MWSLVGTRPSVIELPPFIETCNRKSQSLVVREQRQRPACFRWLSLYKRSSFAASSCTGTNDQLCWYETHEQVHKLVLYRTGQCRSSHHCFSAHNRKSGCLLVPVKMTTTRSSSENDSRCLKMKSITTQWRLAPTVIPYRRIWNGVDSSAAYGSQSIVFQSGFSNFVLLLSDKILLMTVPISSMKLSWLLCSTSGGVDHVPDATSTPHLLSGRLRL